MTSGFRVTCPGCASGADVVADVAFCEEVQQMLVSGVCTVHVRQGMETWQVATLHYW